MMDLLLWGLAFQGTRFAFQRSQPHGALLLFLPEMPGVTANVKISPGAVR
jgi:hypothetical protein